MNFALGFLIVAITAAVFGFSGIGGQFDWAFQAVFVVFLVLFLVTVLTAAISKPPPYCDD